MIDHIINETAKIAEKLERENAKLRSSIRALIEVYVPSDRKAVLLRQHLED